jgi:hypothetical protein
VDEQEAAPGELELLVVELGRLGDVGADDRGAFTQQPLGGGPADA